MGDNFGIHRSAVRTGTEDRTQGQILSDFLVQLEDYIPTVKMFNYVYNLVFVTVISIRFQMPLHLTI